MALPSSVHNERRTVSESSAGRLLAGSVSSTAGTSSGAEPIGEECGGASAVEERLRRCLGEGGRAVDASGRRSSARAMLGSSPSSSACTHKALGPSAMADAEELMMRMPWSARRGGAATSARAPFHNSGGTRSFPTFTGGSSSTYRSAATASESLAPTTNLPGASLNRTAPVASPSCRKRISSIGTFSAAVSASSRAVVPAKDVEAIEGGSGGAGGAVGASPAVDVRVLFIGKGVAATPATTGGSAGGGGRRSATAGVGKSLACTSTHTPGVSPASSSSGSSNHSGASIPLHVSESTSMRAVVARATARVAASRLAIRASCASEPSSRRPPRKLTSSFKSSCFVCGSRVVSRERRCKVTCRPTAAAWWHGVNPISSRVPTSDAYSGWCSSLRSRPTSADAAAI
eukprot:scaffold297022_cov23-Tisochrysis_lutea.AAC.1